MMNPQTETQKLSRIIAVQQMKAKGKIHEEELLQFQYNSGKFSPDEMQMLSKIDWQKMTGLQIIDILDKIYNT
jgi:hypothetical protein